MQRWVIHVDMDAFYAAIEQRDNADLAGKPVIVGGISGRGVVSTASYEARKYGVRSAMSMAEARRRCPQGVFLSCDHNRYSRVSKEIMEVLADFSPIVEPLSLDEAFLEVSGMERLYPDLKDLAYQIKQRIKDEIRLTASVGLAPNKFLAKLASDFQKPDGLMVIEYGKERQVLDKMPITRLWGVGAATAQTLHKIGINTIGDVAKADIGLLIKHCGNLAYKLHSLAHGRDDRPVVPPKAPQSVGKEMTFETDLFSQDKIKAELNSLAERVGWRLRCIGYTGRTITLKVRYRSFQTVTRSRTLAQSTNFDDIIYKTAVELLGECTSADGIRLLGITLSNLETGGQISLFEEQSKHSALYSAVDSLKARFGEGIITKAQLLR
ncbi:DNA polymerase IV [Dendrosporobacter sp. 1207_IL3150]|uniref:DNA polymerase IV n=1 Tax=Dendrosporobacter sp. 1207_IL3150 TaxID=3084054 RepID=UPI002FD91048